MAQHLANTLNVGVSFGLSPFSKRNLIHARGMYLEKFMEKEKKLITKEKENMG